MDLRTYLKATGLTTRQAAKMVGASPGAMMKWKRGERIPDAEHLAKIWKATGGLVAPNDFVRPLLDTLPVGPSAGTHPGFTG